MSAAPLTASPAPARAGRPRRARAVVPLSYLAALAILAITLVPLLFIVIGGFRTTAQLNTAPAGLPHPWALHNYVSILTSGTFWQNLANSAVITANVVEMTRPKSWLRMLLPAIGGAAAKLLVP